MGATLGRVDRPIELGRIWAFLSMVGVGVGVLILSSNILSPYSYWLDELFSVNASSRDWVGLYKVIMADVHPPLYQLILKCWIILFGSGEVATRVLSWLFSVVTLCLAYKMSKRYGSLFLGCFLWVMACNPYFSYYGNEVRAYSMLMCCSTLLLFTMPIEKSRSISNAFLLSCLLASWTHYFGLLMAAVVLFYCFVARVEGIQARLKVVLAGLLITLWPLHHLINGSLIGKTGGSFWIESTGLVDTVRFASTAVIPSDVVFGGFVFVALMAGIFLGLWYVSKRKESRAMASTRFGIQAFAVWCGLIALVGLVDQHTPMSTGRNFIVTVPFFAASVSAIVAGLSNAHPRARLVLLGVVVACCTFLFVKSFEGVSRKAQSPEDWRGATKVAVEQAFGKDLYVVEWGDEITDHYIRKFAPAKPVVHAYRIGETKIKSPSVIIFARLSPKLLDSLLSDMKFSGARRIFPDEKNKEGNRVGVYLVHSNVPELKK